MDKKFFVPFKTAQQLKEKGYPQLEPEHHYNINGEMVIFSDDYEGYTEDTIMRIAQDFYAASTYHEVLDWLQGKGIRICVDCCVYWSGFIDKYETDELEKTKLCNTREEALNESILAALKML